MAPERMDLFWIRSTVFPADVASVIVPNVLCEGLALHCEAAVIVPCGLGADELDTGRGEDVELILVSLDDVDVHQLR